jgi:hypothetical protein
VQQLHQSIFATGIVRAEMRVYGALQVLVNELRDPLLKDIGYDPIQNIAVALANQTGNSSVQAKQAIQQATNAVNQNSSSRHQYAVHKAQNEQAVRRVQHDDSECDIKHTARPEAAESKLHISSDHSSSSNDNSNSNDGSSGAKHSEAKHSEQQKHTHTDSAAIDHNVAVDTTSDSLALKKSSSATAIQKRWRWHRQTKQDKQKQQQRSANEQALATVSKGSAAAPVTIAADTAHVNTTASSKAHDSATIGKAAVPALSFRLFKSRAATNATADATANANVTTAVIASPTTPTTNRSGRIALTPKRNPNIRLLTARSKK